MHLTDRLMYYMQHYVVGGMIPYQNDSELLKFRLLRSYRRLSKINVTKEKDDFKWYGAEKFERIFTRNTARGFLFELCCECIPADLVVREIESSYNINPLNPKRIERAESVFSESVFKTLMNSVRTSSCRHEHVVECRGSQTVPKHTLSAGN